MGQTQLDFDDFSDTAGIVLSTHNANWSNNDINNDWAEAIIAASGLGVEQGASATCGDYRTGQPWTSSQYSEIVFDVLSDTRMGVVVLLGGTAHNLDSGYVCGTIPELGGNLYNIWKVGSPNTPLVTSARTAVAGDKVNLQIIVATGALSVKINDIHQVDLDVVDSSYINGNPGLSKKGTGRFKFWKGGSATDDTNTVLMGQILT